MKNKTNLFLFSGIMLMLLGASAQGEKQESPVEYAKRVGSEPTQALHLAGGTALRLTLIPPGSFIMGSPDNEPERDSNESPQHLVTISKPFYMGIHEVTQSQYEPIMNSNPSAVKGADLPVDGVSWNDVAEFCRRLSGQVKKIVRLPTEAEWEYACRAGARTRFCCGDDEGQLADYAWFGDRAGGVPRQVGQKKPSAFGLYDMHGNVVEWCNDWFAPYNATVQTDPQGTKSGTERVIRGGNAGDLAKGVRSARRFGRPPSSALAKRGFRVVMEMETVGQSSAMVSADRQQIPVRPDTSIPAVQDGIRSALPPWLSDEGGQWPQFRGPGGAGISAATTVPVTWTENDYNWKVNLPGPGHSSPVVWGRRVYVTCGDQKTGTRMVLCLDPANGQKIWQKDYPSHTYQMSPDCNYATASPAADADGVIVTWTTPEEVTLLALDNDGKETWRRNLGPWASKLGSGTSPVIVGDVVFLANEQEEIRNQDGSLKVSPKGFLIGVSRKTGETRWQIDRRAGEFSSYSTPCLRQGEDGRIELVHASNVHGITGLDPATGKIKWEMPGQFQEFVGSAVADAGLVVVRDTHSSKSVRVMAVKPGDSAKGEKPSVIYDIPKRGIAVITPLIKDGRLFVWDGDGTVLCHRAATGEMVWRQRLGARFSGSPVWVNNRLYCISKEGEVFVLSAADKYELLARVPLGEPSFSTPAVAGGVMYLRTRTQLFSLGGKK